MPDETESFDADIDAILNGGEAPAKEPTVTPGAQTEAAKEALRFGNRDWASPSDLGKAYESLLKDYSRKSNEYKSNEKWVNWGKAIDKHPELRSTLEQRIDEFTRNQGRAPAQPQGGQIPHELQERLDKMENFVAAREVEAELSALKSKFSPDKAMISATLAKAEEMLKRGIDIPLEDVYRIVSYDAKAMQAQADGEKRGFNNAAVKKAANVGGSSASPVAPGAKSVDKLSNEEYDRALSDELGKYGITG